MARAVRQTQEELAALPNAHRDAFQGLTQPAIVTSIDGAVQLWNAASARLWRRTEAEVRGKKLTALALPGIPGDLLVEKTAAVREGKAERQSGEGVLPSPAGPLELSVDVSALRDTAGEMSGLFYVVHDVTPLRSLETELRQARDERERATEDLEAANEELQSSNEELETTNEELESTNAELDATNRELVHRTDELNVLSFYQKTIIRSLSAAVVVIDPRGRITLWNLAAERVFGLTEGEALGQLVWSLRIPVIDRALIKRIRKNLAGRLALRLEDITYGRVGGGRGHAALSAVPLIDEERVFGAVIILEDTTRAVILAEERLKDRARSTAARRVSGGDKASS